MMKENIVGSMKVTIKDAGHIMNMDQPEEFNQLIADFITDLQ